MRCDEVVDGVDGPNGPPSELRCTLEEISMEGSTEGVGKPSKPKGNISWVSAEEAVRAEVRLYSHLFTVDSPDDKWEEQVGNEKIHVAHILDVSPVPHILDSNCVFFYHP